MAAERLYCYRNLKTHLWGLYSKPKHKCDLTGAPVGREHPGFPVLVMRDVKFVVNARARQWCLDHAMPSGKPYGQVHAFAIGQVISTSPSALPAHRTRIAVSYNPAKGASFYRRDTGAPVARCDYALFNADGAWAIGNITSRSARP